MQCYTELTPPTAVTHSLSLPFLSPSANNLVIAKTNLLQIFSLKTVVTHTTDASLSGSASGHVGREYANGPDSSLPDPTATRGDRLHTTKLVLIAQYQLFGTITSLARVKILQSKSGGEALLVALRDAKLSLVEWDPERFSISTISIHYYEREDILSSPWEPDLEECRSELIVDPSSRCAVLKFGARNLAIIPFHQVGDDLVMDDYDLDIDGEQPERKVSVSKNVSDDVKTQKTPYAASFVLSLLALDPSLSHPIHLAFLNEYREPTFGVLYSQVASSSGLLHERQDNVSYAVYTLDLEQRASTTLLSVNNLPYDLFAVIPLSRRIGGNLLVGGNEIIHVDQSGKSNGIAVNEFARQSTSFSLADQSDLCMRLENCVVKELAVDNAESLIILDTGELAILSFKIDGRSVSGLSIVRVDIENGGAALNAGPSCASIIGRGRLFIGSENADSIILGWSRKSDRLQRKRSRTDIDMEGDEDDLELEEEDMEEDEDDLYADSRPEQKAHEQIPSPSIANMGDYHFRVHDSLMNVGPMNDIALRSKPKKGPLTADSRSLAPGAGLMTTSGRGRAGGLTMFEKDIEARVIKQYKIGNAQRLWSISTKQNLKPASGDPNQGAHDHYIFTFSMNDNAAQKSTVYRIKGEDLEEIDDVEFDEDAGETIDVDTINGGLMIAQVTQNQVRTYDGGEPVSIRCLLDYSIITNQLMQHLFLMRAYKKVDLFGHYWRNRFPNLNYGDLEVMATSIMSFYSILSIASIQTNIHQWLATPKLYLPCNPTMHHASVCSDPPADVSQTLVFPRYYHSTKMTTRIPLSQRSLARVSRIHIFWSFETIPAPWFSLQTRGVRSTIRRSKWRATGCLDLCTRTPMTFYA